MKPKISIGSLGGTISMTSQNHSDGITPKLSAKDFINAIPHLQDIVEVYAESLFTLPSGHLRFEMLLDSIKWAKKQVENGSNAVILTQGTDTLEESAFFCDLFWDKKEPLILMGAMRGAEAIGADGLENLYSSIICGISENSRNRGVLVVMNDIIHSARWVRKSHSLLVSTFNSDDKILGIIAEGKAQYFSPAFKLESFEIPQSLNKKVFLYEQSLSDDAKILEWVEGNYDGLVISGYGAGHVSLQTCEYINKIIKKIPIVVSTRTTDGPSAYKTYGYKGAEIDLQKRGVMMSGWLSGLKSRLLLWTILNLEKNPKEFISYTHKMIL